MRKQALNICDGMTLPMPEPLTAEEHGPMYCHSMSVPQFERTLGSLPAVQ